MDFGTLIKLKRKEKNLTLSNLAKLSDVSTSYLSRLENGERTPVITIALRLARELDISFKEIEDVYSIKLNQCENNDTPDYRDNKKTILPVSKDYITLNNINSSLSEIANGNIDFVEGTFEVFENLVKLRKKPIMLLAIYEQHIQIIEMKYYNEKVISFLKDYLEDTTKKLLIIEGNLIKSDIHIEAFDLLSYLEFIENSFREDNSNNYESLSYIKKYLEEINY